MFVYRYEGTSVAIVGLTEREAAIIADALDAEAEAVLEPNPEGTPDLYDIVSGLADHFRTLAYTLELRGALYDAKTAGRQWGPAPDPEPEPARPGPLRRALIRLLGPLAPWLARSATATGLYVWLLGPEAAREYMAQAAAIIARRGPQ